jgi:succinate dehydrogenase / fumarate reductase, cytochrome b subunit
MTSPTLLSKPVFRNIHISQILTYRLPITGRISILHRVSGALLFLALPWILFMFDRSLISESTFARLSHYAGHWLVKLALLVLIWGFIHHLCAGARFLLMDIHVAVDKEGARKSAWAVLFVSLPLTLLAAMRLFGVL